ncbi:hydrogenase [Pseudolabrys sp. FHR47]|uniref:hydrogenase n=1 Tax=Pseudolabrys sp. FHR47 TaxID=2562284 RepID=UPI0010BF4E1E|nr:hydrogenase [Pseudolabrys sp. FHR47]
MNAAMRPDLIDVSIALSGGQVAEVEIGARRPVGFGRLARGRTGEEAVALLPRLFVLCAAAQSVAGVMAIEAARGTSGNDASMRQRAVAVVAERTTELLRGTLVALAGDYFDRFAPSLRDVFASARTIGARSAPGAADIEALDGALDAAGLPAGCFADIEAFEDWIGGPSPLAELLRPLMWRGAALGLMLDPLDADADGVVGECLRAEGAAFAARPGLDGRAPETGALARNAGHPLLAALDGADGAAIRLLARLIEVRDAPDLLRRLLDDDPQTSASVVRAYRLDDRLGLAAVECARGRLHHLVALDAAGRVDRLEILAPTEWNFHAEGPLARALRGAALDAGDAARGRVERLVAAFDPCVAYRVRIAEAGHA